MNKFINRFSMFLVPVLIAAFIFGMLSLMFDFSENNYDTDEQTRITIYCEIDLKPAIEEIIEGFQRRTGIRLAPVYGSSSELVGNASFSSEMDVFIAADKFYTTQTSNLGITEQAVPIGCLMPVILIRETFAAKIESLKDLATADLRLGITTGQDSSINTATSRIFRDNNIPTGDNIVSIGENCLHLAREVEFGNIDAAIVWLPFAKEYSDKTQIIYINQEENTEFIVSAAAALASENPEAAKTFISFLEGSFSSNIFEKYGYKCK